MVNQESKCLRLRFIFSIQNYIAPINFICFCQLIFQEFQYFKQNLEYQHQLEEENNAQKKIYSINIQIFQNQKLYNKQSIKSQSSFVNPMEASSKYYQYKPNFKNEKVQQKLQKIGISQFGDSQHNSQMINSKGNIKNGKLFEFSLKENKQDENNFKKLEESQTPEIFSQVNNPMESGSVLVTIH